MKRAELAKVLLDEIKRTRAQLSHLRTVLMMRREKRTSGLDHCDECEMPIQSVQIDGEIKSMTEDQGLKNLTEATSKAEAAEQLLLPDTRKYR